MSPLYDEQAHVCYEFIRHVHDVQYMALYEGSKALDALTQLTGMVLDRLHYRPKELNQMLKKYLK